MSLFNAIDFWSTRCGDDEEFGFNSLMVTDLDESGKNKIITGSFSGLLRIYEVLYDPSETQSFSFKASDLLLETQLLQPIVHVNVGRLVSGSRTLHIVIGHSKSIAVYSLSSIPGSTEHGNQFELRMVYEHAIQHSMYKLLVGSFGGVKGRDFLCAYALDGTLTFFEQETFVSETQLPTFLLPSAIAYVSESDSFVTLTADWCVESYRYEDLVNTSKRKVSSVWSCNLGDTVIDIQTIQQGAEMCVVILSEHNVICVNTKGVVKFTKRLQFSPISFRVYVNEVNNALMILIVSDSGILFVYEQTTLRWSAKLPIVPTSIFRANLGVDGILVLLSDKGELKCCYLGTKPSLFVAPPLENSITNYKNVNRKLEKLQEQIENFKTNNTTRLTLEITEQEVQVSLKVLPYDQSLNYCQLVTELVPSRPIPNVHITFESVPPFSIQPSNHTLASLSEKTVVNTSIQINELRDVVPTTLEVTAIVSYFGNSSPCVIRKHANVSLRFVVSACPLVEEKNFVKISINSNKPPLPLTVVFQEFRGERWTESECNDENATFCLRYNSEKKCIVSLMKLRYGYEFSTNSIPLMHALMKHVLFKCKSHKGGAETNAAEPLVFESKSVPREELMKAVQNHVAQRSEIRNLQSYLEKLSAQYRLIQRRFLIKLKDKTSVPMPTLQTLYNDIYDKLLNTIRNIEEKQNALIVCSSELQSIIDLALELMRMNSLFQTDRLKELRTALSLTSLNHEPQGWEERTVANLIHLLRTTFSNSTKDQLHVLPTPDKSVNDSGQLWRLMGSVFDRISNGKFSVALKLDQNQGVPTIMEDDEVEEEPVKENKFHFVKQEKLLSKRQNYNESIIRSRELLLRGLTQQRARELAFEAGKLSIEYAV